jgi:hypothetical protein
MERIEMDYSAWPRQLNLSLFVAMFVAVLLESLGLLLLASPASAQLSSTPDDITVQTDGRVWTILAVGNCIYLGGEFTTVNGVPRSRLAAIDASTGELTDWAPSANNRVTALAANADGSRIYVGGSFTSMSGVSRRQLAAVDPISGAVDPLWGPRADQTVYALAVMGNRVYLGGAFTTVNGQSRSRLALVDGTSGELNPNWVPTATNTVRTMGPSMDGTRMYVGGLFGSISGVTRSYLGAVDPVTGSVQSWQPTTRPNGLIYNLAESGGRVYTAEDGVGGAVAAYTTATGSRTWSQWGDGDIQAVTVLGSRLYAGGHFVTLGDQNRSFFAALDPATGALDASWTPSGNGGAGVWSLVADPLRARLYAGGDFTTISGEPYLRFAQFSESSESDITPPTILSVSPNDLSLNTAVDANVEATFSEAMDSSTITNAAFTLTKQGTATPLTATVSYDAAARKAILNPAVNLEPGTSYTATVKGGPNGARDLAGNSLGADKVWSFSTRAATVPPETTIVSGPEGTVSSASATFEFTSSEPGSTFQCSLDGAAYSACSSPHTYTGLSNGSHTFQVRATVAGSNVDPTPASRTWKVQVKGNK